MPFAMTLHLFAFCHDIAAFCHNATMQLFATTQACVCVCPCVRVCVCVCVCVSHYTPYWIIGIFVPFSLVSLPVLTLETNPFPCSCSDWFSFSPSVCRDWTNACNRLPCGRSKRSSSRPFSFPLLLRYWVTALNTTLARSSVSAERRRV